jgi:hypothetical protein
VRFARPKIFSARSSPKYIYFLANLFSILLPDIRYKIEHLNDFFVIVNALKKSWRYKNHWSIIEIIIIYPVVIWNLLKLIEELNQYTRRTGSRIFMRWVWFLCTIRCACAACRFSYAYFYSKVSLWRWSWILCIVGIISTYAGVSTYGFGIFCFTRWVNVGVMVRTGDLPSKRFSTLLSIYERIQMPDLILLKENHFAYFIEWRDNNLWKNGKSLKLKISGNQNSI